MLADRMRLRMFPTGGDPYWGSVVFLSHFDGVDGSTSFVDQKGATITVVGNTQLTTAQLKYGTASAVFDGNGDCLKVPNSANWAFGTGDFTVEMFCRPTTTSTVDYLFLVCHDQIGGTRGWLFFVESGTGKLVFTLWDGTTPAAVNGSTNFLSTYLNTWVHIAATRSSGTMRLFINGVVVSTVSASAISVGAPSEPMVIGIGWGIGAPVNNSPCWVGNMDELRITKGVARYTADFTPPSAAFPNS